MEIKHWERLDDNFLNIEFEDGESGKFQASKLKDWTPEDDERFMNGGILKGAAYDYVTQTDNYGYGFYVCGYNGNCQTELGSSIRENYHLYVF